MIYGFQSARLANKFALFEIQKNYTNKQLGPNCYFVTELRIAKEPRFCTFK